MAKARYERFQRALAIVLRVGKERCIIIQQALIICFPAELKNIDNWLKWGDRPKGHLITALTKHKNWGRQFGVILKSSTANTSSEKGKENDFDKLRSIKTAEDKDVQLWNEFRQFKQTHFQKSCLDQIAVDVPIIKERDGLKLTGVDDTGADEDPMTKVLSSQKLLRDQLIESDRQLPTRVVLCGKTISTSIIVAALGEEIVFRTNSIVEALDICYKCMREFPIFDKFGNICPHIWCFIERYVYEIKGKHNYNGTNDLTVELERIRLKRESGK
ncbi:hypothetical protein QAD02_002569 [Eretmocerus hayati]|uniref:Uncharacterized protein n=1 Tax=Eretmocerus hayati TaxID=131215 RepID=A0ACC2NP62_9HYME|nr:hypothetical protein QAD02_002569 [Eretmocerus hayati]